MTDVNHDLSVLTSQLQNSHVDDQGLSFLGRTLKLNNEKDAEVVTDEIDKCTNLVLLNLDGNTVGIEAAKKIGQSLSKHPEFKKAIWKNMFTGRTKEEIPPALEFLGNGVIIAQAQLVELDLSDNAFGPIGVKGISNLIKSFSFYTLQELKLNNNGLGITGGKLLAEALRKCYEVSNKKFALRVFQAGRNRLENPGAEALAKVFKMLGTLKEVSMPQNGIYTPGCIALSEAFKYNPHLKVINLNDNTVQKKGATAIATVLPALQVLETLNLGDCLLKTEGAISIAKALSNKHLKLQTLILEHNEINIEGGMEIIKAMQNKVNLITLDLNGNRFGQNIQDLVHEFKKSDRFNALKSFSEDEGSDEENDESESEDETASETEEDDNDDSDENVNLETITSKFNDTSLQKMSVSEFLNTPSSKNFLELGDNKFELFKTYIETSEKEELLKNMITIVLTVSNLCENNHETVKKEGISCSLQLYKYLFNWAIKNDKLSLVTNAILAQLHLIKAEEKSSLIDCNLKTCINVLQEAVHDNDTIPNYSREMINIFLQKRQTNQFESEEISTIS